MFHQARRQSLQFNPLQADSPALQSRAQHRNRGPINKRDFYRQPKGKPHLDRQRQQAASPVEQSTRPAKSSSSRR